MSTQMEMESPKPYEIDRAAYIIEMAKLVGALAEKVNARIKQDYTPIGQPFIWEGCLCQAVILK